ncbi:MAG: zf-TFIIB domain-containing protein [Acidimicrobiales bacterium]|jgi:hypothetical protein|nr:zf-TFIIB domain-containing protein [Acidimicrobiales bacterium]
MRCPTGCDAQLVMAERHGVEIDYCPTCRGVWLDRGELDKLIERGSAAMAAPPPPAVSSASVRPPRASPAPYPQGYGDPRDYRDGQWYDDRRYGKKKKRKNFLEEMFDF